jgi:hypothetical protein
MNREKKQILVVAVLAVMILGVGAFQFMNASAEPTPVATKAQDKKEDKKDDKPEGPKNPQFRPLTRKDPFETATFAMSHEESTPTPPKDPVPPKQDHTGGSRPISLPTNNPGWNFPPGGVKEDLKPEEPPKPVFGYRVVGVVEGAYPAVVFEDSKGNQQLVEIGQGIGPNATVIGINRGKVRIKFNAETLVLNVGGNPNAK